MPGLKPLVALYKTYRGGEWFGPSLESVHRHVAGVVAVMSDQPWRGVPGNVHPAENCRAPLAAFQARHPEAMVMSVRPVGRQSTEEQYRAGLGMIRSTFGSEVGVLIVDTDEIWEDASLTALREAMTTDRRSLYFRAGIWTYLRSPLYRVVPQETAWPVVGLANPSLPTGNSRFANLFQIVSRDRIKDVPCSFHHYGYVRLDSEEIVGKLACSISQDGTPCVANWKRAVWDELPDGRDIHPQVGFERCWGGVEELAMAGVPRAVVESDAFWGGLAYHRPSPSSPAVLAFTVDDQGWRRRAECMPHGECLVSITLPQFAIPLCAAMNQLMSGRWMHWDRWNYLVPRLRMSFRETVQLATLAASVSAGGKLLEIGSGYGGSMAAMAMVRPDAASLTAVDPYLPYDEENITTTRGFREGSAAEFRNTLSVVAPEAPVVLVEMSSAEAAPRCDDASLDLLLVDGNHSYANCREDLALWWPKVRPGGLVLVHDYATRFPGVVRAVLEFEAETGLTFSLPALSTLAWLRRPV